MEVICSIPPAIAKQINRTHTNPENWNNIYYFVKKHRCSAPPLKEVTSALALQNNVLYRCSQLSAGDDIWDYFRMLKPHLHGVKNIAIEKRSKKRNKKYITFQKQWYTNKPFLLTFD